VLYRLIPNDDSSPQMLSGDLLSYDVTIVLCQLVAGYALDVQAHGVLVGCFNGDGTNNASLPTDSLDTRYASDTPLPLHGTTMLCPR
jgi:hypothetical protein